MKQSSILLNIFCLILFSISAQASNNDNIVSKSKESISTSNEKGFLENKGQMMDNKGMPVPFVLFKTEASGINIWITESGITMQTLRVEEKKEEEIKVYWERIDLELKDATILKENILKEGTDLTNFNFFYPHCPNGIYGVKEYEKITIKEIYPKIDWVIYRKKNGEMKYDFVVHPGGDYQQIQLLYLSKTPIKINEQGQLELYTDYGSLTENTPISFYKKREIKTRFTQNYQKLIEINGDNGYETSISFSVNSNFKLQTSDLAIDPQLTWSTFYGGSFLDGFKSIDTDNNGNIFVTGYVGSFDFPLDSTGNFFQGTYGGNIDLFILKFSNGGNRLWATYYGGSLEDRGYSITIDTAGNVFIAGLVRSTDFPLQNAGTYSQAWGGGRDAFILKFDNAGNRLWATYYGGTSNDQAYSITTDTAGNVFVTGDTFSTDFPVQNAGTFFQGTKGGSSDSYILKFDNTGNLLWGTYYGGSLNGNGYSITTDVVGNVFVAGRTFSTDFPLQNAGTFFQGTKGGGTDVFILKFDNAGNRLWATYYGGSSEDYGNTIITDATGNIFVTGESLSTDLPLQNMGTFFQGSNAGIWDAFILKFDNAGNRLWATYYGGSGNETQGVEKDITIDGCGNVYVSFLASGNLPTQSSCDVGGHNDTTFNGGSVNLGDQFITLFSNVGVLLWATYLGGDGPERQQVITVDGNNNLFIAGEWGVTGNGTSGTYPLINPGGGAYYDNTFNGSDDSFIAKFTPSPIIANATVTQTICGNPCSGSATVNIVSPSACAYTYLWSNGQTTQTSTGLCVGAHTVTVTNQMCKDTLLNVIIQSVPPSGTDVQTACDSITWIDGITYFVSTNTPTFNIIGGAASGCDSVVNLNLNINTINPSVMQAGTLLTANESGATYQWLNCLGMTPISGATSQLYTATANGNYAVIVSNNGCTDTSTCYTVIGVGIIENDFGNDLLLYPNPTDENFSIDLGDNYQIVTITITDLNGKLILSKKYNESQLLNLKIEEPAAIYLLMIESGDKKAVIRLVKE